MKPGNTRPAPGRRAPVTIDDTERQCPEARYTISRAVCNERQRRRYFECPACDWAEANRARIQEKKEAQKLLQRYGF